MRNFALVIISFLSLSSGWTYDAIKTSNSLSVCEGIKKNFFDCNYERLLPLVERSFDWRKKAQALRLKLTKDKQIGPNRENPILKEQLNYIYNNVSNYSEYRRELFDIVKLSERYIQFPQMTVGDFPNKIALGEPLVLNPLTKIGQRRLQMIRLSLAAALILFDNYLLGVAPYENIKDFRFLLLSDHAEGRFIHEIMEAYNSPEHLQMLAEAIRIYSVEYRYRKSAKLGSAYRPDVYEEIKDFDTEKDQKLDEIILNSTTFRRSFSGLKAKESKLSLLAMRLQDVIAQAKSGIVYSLSKKFGNAVGLLSSRYGVMIANPDNFDERLPSDKIKAIADNIENQLQPMDVLLEKTVFRATDKFIPGHFGHVAVYLGTKSQILETFGAKFWAELQHLKDSKGRNIGYAVTRLIEQGHTVVEALRPGVQINTLEHFLDVDDLLTIRPTTMSLEEKKVALKAALMQIGKRYDFNFDVETDTTIVCSEIVYVVYTNPKYQWRTKKQLGRFTISPDNVLQAAFSTRQFEPILYYSFGRKIELPGAELENLLNQFMAGDYSYAGRYHGINPY